MGVYTQGFMVINCCWGLKSCQVCNLLLLWNCDTITSSVNSGMFIISSYVTAKLKNKALITNEAWHACRMLPPTLWHKSKGYKGKRGFRWMNFFFARLENPAKFTLMLFSPVFASCHSHLLPHVIQEHGGLEQTADPLHVSLCKSEAKTPSHVSIRDLSCSWSFRKYKQLFPPKSQIPQPSVNISSIVRNWTTVLTSLFLLVRRCLLWHRCKTHQSAAHYTLLWKCFII